jgi:hypothetical protein
VSGKRAASAEAKVVREFSPLHTRAKRRQNGP